MATTISTIFRNQETPPSAFARKSNFFSHMREFIREAKIDNSPTSVVENMIAFFDTSSASNPTILGVGSYGMVFEAGADESNLGDMSHGTAAYKLLMNTQEGLKKHFAKQDDTDGLIGTYLTPFVWKNGYGTSREVSQIPIERTGSFFETDSKKNDVLLNAADYTGAWHVSWPQLGRLAVAMEASLTSNKLVGPSVKVRTDVAQMLAFVKEMVESTKNDPEMFKAAANSIGGSILRIEKADGQLLDMMRSLPLNSVIDVALSMLIQIGFTLRETFLEIGYSHGDAALRNILYDKIDSIPGDPHELTYNIPGKTRGHQYRIVSKPGEPFTLFLLSDFGMSGLDNKTAIGYLGYQTRSEFFYERGTSGRVMQHGGDLNTIGGELLFMMATRVLETTPKSPALIKRARDFIDFIVDDLLFTPESMSYNPVAVGSDLGLGRDIHGLRIIGAISYRTVVSELHSVIKNEPDITRRSQIILGSLGNALGEKKSPMAPFMYSTHVENVSVFTVLVNLPRAAVVAMSNNARKEFWVNKLFDSYKIGSTKRKPARIPSEKSSTTVLSESPEKKMGIAAPHEPQPSRAVQLLRLVDIKSMSPGTPARFVRIAPRPPQRLGGPPLSLRAPPGETLD